MRERTRGERAIRRGSFTRRFVLLHQLRIHFEALHERFGTDFSELNRQWPMFFNTEGASPRAILIGIFAVLVCGGAAGMLAAALDWPTVAAWALAIALLVCGGWLFSRWFGRELQPLTVAGLAEIVQAGSWPSDPADVR